ncbi:hypothetical protein [Kerstersia similis]|uniref:hypothetical protein n=1 Tax=Kerstersia similis TaxID=206505 RepID=UPI0039EF1408
MPEPLPALRQTALAVYRGAAAELQIFRLADRHYVMKAWRAKPGASFRAGFGALACLLAFGEFARPSRLRQGDIHFEAGRLRALAHGGCAVPEVYLDEERFIVLEHVGRSLDEIVRDQPLAKAGQLYDAAVDDLAGFHRQGFWHGGAQLRNLTLRDGRLYRIDFEERFGAALSHGLAAAYDLFLLLGDILWRLEPDEVGPTGKRLMRRYFSRAGAQGADQDALLRLNRLLAPVRGLANVLPARLREKRDIRRVARFAAVLKEWCTQERAAVLN